PPPASRAHYIRSAHGRGKGGDGLLAQDDLDLGAVLGGEFDLDDLAIGTIPDVAGDLAAHRVVMGVDNLAADVDLLDALVDDRDLPVAALDRIEQHRLLDRVGAPQAGWDERGRQIDDAAVVGAAQAIARELERDLACLTVVVALRREGSQLTVLPLLLGL